MQTLDEAIDEKLICAHCGDPCPDRKLASEDQVFCCLGCKTVYEIIHENGLDAYYRIEQDPGISLKHNKGREYYNFLDKDDVRKRILNFESPELAKVRLFIPVIHCSSCIWLLENLYKLHVGVIRSEVNFPRKEVFIDFNPSKISLRELVELMASLGYDPDIDIEGEENEVNRVGNYNRNLLIKIGVAGFCFGNIMLLSFPEYLGLENLADNDFSKFFSYINILFSLPVLFYSASGYYEAAYKGLKQKIISIDVPIAIGILALSLRSIYEVVSQEGPGYFDSLSGLVFFLLIGKWFQNKTYESLLFDRSYKSYFPVAVTLVGELVQESVLIEDLKIGDTILIRNNELIPADTELLSEEAMIDNSFVTGESTTIRKQKGEYVFAGGRQTGPAIELKVIKEVSQSYLTQLWNDDAFRKNTHSTRRILVDRISKYFTIVILMIAIVASIFWIFYDPSKTINVFTAVLIVACPCALALSTPFAVGTAMRVLSRNGCYLKNGEIIEEIDKINHVVFDKTGTITNQGMENITFLGELTSIDTQRVCAIASNSYHPLSRRIANYLVSKPTTKLSGFKEYPGKGIEANVDDHVVRMGSSEFVIGESESNDLISSSRVYISINNELKGHFEITNQYREGFEDVIESMGTGNELSILSGDNSAEKEFLASIFPKGSELKFEQSAYDKLDFVKDLQERNNGQVMMIGDGLNDAGALAQANIGVAVTEDVNNFTPASDIILAGEKFGKLPDLIKFSSSTVRIIVASFIISFLYNVVGLSFAVSGNLTPVFAAILMPLSSISVVLFTTIAVNWYASRWGFK